MGLDMYLTKETYIGHKEYRKYNGQEDAVIKIKGVSEDRVKEVVEEIMYWRKANSIHSWFVENVQGGLDECQKSEVEIEKLEELRDICGEIIDHNHLAEEMLPSTSGFFFGSTDYDEWYWEDIQRTYDGLNKLLEEDNTRSCFYYQASW